jgi:hypothetical protein
VGSRYCLGTPRAKSERNAFLHFYIRAGQIGVLTARQKPSCIETVFAPFPADPLKALSGPLSPRPSVAGSGQSRALKVPQRGSQGSRKPRRALLPDGAWWCYAARASGKPMSACCSASGRPMRSRRSYAAVSGPQRRIAARRYDRASRPIARSLVPLFSRSGPCRSPWPRSRGR